MYKTYCIFREDIAYIVKSEISFSSRTGKQFMRVLILMCVFSYTVLKTQIKNIEG